MPCPPPGDLPNPGIERRSPTLQMDSLLSEPPEKLKNTGVGSLPSPGDFPDPGIELASPALQVDSLPAELPGKPFNIDSQVKHLLKHTLTLFQSKPIIIERVYKSKCVMHQYTMYVYN